MKTEILGVGGNTIAQAKFLDHKQLLKLGREERKYFQEFAAKVSMGDTHLYRAFLSVLTDINVRRKIKESKSIQELAEYISEEYSVSFYEIANFLERFLEELQKFREESGAEPREVYLGLGLITPEDLFRLGKEGADEILELADNFEPSLALEILNEKNAPFVYLIAASDGDEEVMRRAYYLIRPEELRPPVRYSIHFIHRLLFNEDPDFDLGPPAKDSLSKAWRALALIFDSVSEAKREIEEVDFEELFRKGPWIYSFATGVKYLIKYFQGNLREVAERVLEILSGPKIFGQTPRTLLLIMLLNTVAEISEESKSEENIREFEELLDACVKCPLRTFMAATLCHLNAKGASKIGPPKWFVDKRFPGIEVIAQTKREEVSLLSGEKVEVNPEESVFSYFRTLKRYCWALKKCSDRKYEEAREELQEVIKELEEKGYLKKATEAKLTLAKCLVEIAKRTELDKAKVLREALDLLDEVRSRLEKMRKQTMLSEVEDYKEMINHLLRTWERKYR